MKKLLLLGMGNAIVSDDRIGLLVAEKVRPWVKNPQIEVRTTEAGGIYLLDYITGYDCAIIVNAIKTGRYRPGEIIKGSRKDFDFASRGTVTQKVSFYDLIEIGKKMDLKVPDRIEIIAIEISDNITVSTKVTEEVYKAIAPAIDKVKIIAESMGFKF